MKRKVSKKSGTKSSEDENGVEQQEAEPQTKTGRRSGRKSEQNREESGDEKATSSEDEDREFLASKKNGKGAGRKTKGRKSKSETQKENEHVTEDEEEPEVEASKENGNNKSAGRKSKGAHSKADIQPPVEETDPLGGNSDDAEYEVEAVLDEKTVKGLRHYLIRWKGYTEESDTWEPESTLDCKALIKAYKAKKNKKAEKKQAGKTKKANTEDGWDENDNFEVDRITDVYFHKNGKRDFLVSWKGYPSSANSWEPEDNMDCKDLIAKFMEKVERAKQYEGKEAKLRVNPKPVKRLAFNMHENSRRLSKRQRGKDRVHYFDAE